MCRLNSLLEPALPPVELQKLDISEHFGHQVVLCVIIKSLQVDFISLDLINSVFKFANCKNYDQDHDECITKIADEEREHAYYINDCPHTQCDLIQKAPYIDCVLGC